MIEIDYASSPVPIRPHSIHQKPTGFSIGLGISEYTFFFRDVAEVRAAEPWPEIEVRWKHIGGLSSRRFVPRFKRENQAIEDALRHLFEHIERYRPHLADRGWLDAPVVSWERAERLPGAAKRAAPSSGGYRGAARERVEPILAERASPTVADLAADWLRSRRSFPFLQQPGRVLVTQDFVYVQRRNRSVWRLPLSALRVARRQRAAVVYVFGRYTQLVLPCRDGCAVERVLDAQLTLASQASGALPAT